MAGATVRLLTKADLAQLSVIAGKQNIIGWRLYDTLTYPAAGGVVAQNFFADTKGAQGLVVTNLDQPNQLISGQSMVVEKIKMNLIAAAGEANLVTSFQDKVKIAEMAGAFTLYINNVQYAQGPLQALLGGGLIGFGDGGGGAAALPPYATPRVVDCVEIYPYLVIPPTTSFQLVLSSEASPALTQAVRAEVSLIGQLVRLQSA